jgi:hypothetical protein
MKKQIYISLITLGLLTALAATPVYAQFQTPIKLSVPFAFTVGDKTMPAGEYTLKPANDAGLYSRLLIRSKDGKTVAIILTGVIQASAVQEEAKVTFNRYGDQYFLSQVWMPGTDYARQLRKSDVELRAASSGAQKETVSITAKR